MAVIRDPAFWKRFSTAVHLDEAVKESSSSPEALNHSDSWLERQNKKSRRRTFVCWVFWLCFFAVGGGVVVVVLWLNAQGRFDKVKPYEEGNVAQSSA